MKLFRLKNNAVGFFWGALDGVSFSSTIINENISSFKQDTNILIGKTFVLEHPKFKYKKVSFYIFGPVKICLIENYF